MSLYLWLILLSRHLFSFLFLFQFYLSLFCALSISLSAYSLHLSPSAVCFKCQPHTHTQLGSDDRSLSAWQDDRWEGRTPRKHVRPGTMAQWHAGQFRFQLWIQGSMFCSCHLSGSPAPWSNNQLPTRACSMTMKRNKTEIFFPGHSRNADAQWLIKWL